ncbi:site-specific integrase [Bacteroides stercorirosoris]|uniref:Site-specific integrase n=4 Tax=Bacteroidales TaxID=171549 RepID=A0A4S2FGE2_9BACT|nr:site-specific integrase [Phocaeicola sartorii]TGY67857.1 site-specific integrase [Phocaeicola sartorii]
MRSTFRLLFYINRQKIKKTGKCPVMGRITLDGKVSQYSTGEEVPPEYWDAGKGRAVVHGKDSEMTATLRELNRKLEELEEKAKAAYKKNVDSTGYVSAELIKNAVTGKAQPKETLLALFDEHNEEYAKRVGVDRTRHTYVRYLTGRRHLYDFLQYKYGAEDMALRSVDMRFIENFHFYLSTVLRLKTVSLNDYLILLCKIVRLAVKRRILGRYPFTGYKLETPPKLHRHLTGEQLAKLMAANLPTYRLCHTRDLFVFSAFTGLGRAEMAELSESHIVTDENGSKWIYIHRLKTKVECRIKLLDIPLKIMEKYKGEGTDGRLFYVPVTSSLCRSLKIIGEICGLDCHLTYYMARHTYATEVCLSNGVPIETISRMMGHSNIRTTQIYAEITNQKIRKDFKILSEKTKDQYSLPEDNMPSRVYRCGQYSGWKKECGRQKDGTDS